MPKPRIRIAPNRIGPVLKIAVGTHYISLPVDQARSALDAAHDALDEYEARERQETTP
ncbi:hypothetical protein [Pseudoclavibacter helvolus]|uniref:hypothetical protein n=1 Tax=Pseudoclavibacter helvolus TaxID=255205 RepID=UPI000B072584|nr:hypothetical protein [Pseudoclavibacter helvolus]